MYTTYHEQKGECAVIYKIDVGRWGSFFSVPCSVAQKHLKLSSGDFIKVLLCVLSGGSPHVDTAEVSKLSGIVEETVEEALLYWNSLGIITIEGKERAKLREYSVSKDTTEAVSQSNAVSAPAEKKTVIRYSPADILKLAESSEDIRMMFTSVEQALARTVNQTEQAALVDIHEYYGFPVASVILLAQYCSGIGKSTMAYIRSVAKDWHAKGIIEPKEVEQEVIRLTEYHSFENEVKRVLGLSAKTTASQRSHFEKWQQMGIAIELIELAGDISIDNTDKHVVNLRYVDKILSAWNDAGITNEKQAEAFESNKSSASVPSKKSSSNTSNNGKSYDINEIDRLAKDYVPKLSDDD